MNFDLVDRYGLSFGEFFESLPVGVQRSEDTFKLFVRGPVSVPLGLCVVNEVGLYVRGEDRVMFVLKENFEVPLVDDGVLDFGVVSGRVVERLGDRIGCRLINEDLWSFIEELHGDEVLWVEAMDSVRFG